MLKNLSREFCSKSSFQHFRYVPWFSLEILLKHRGSGSKLARFPVHFNRFSIRFDQNSNIFKNTSFEKNSSDIFFYMLLLHHKLHFRTLYGVVCDSTPWACKYLCFSSVHFHLLGGSIGARISAGKVFKTQIFNISEIRHFDPSGFR